MAFGSCGTKFSACQGPKHPHVCTRMETSPNLKLRLHPNVGEFGGAGATSEFFTKAALESIQLGAPLMRLKSTCAASVSVVALIRRVALSRLGAAGLKREAALISKPTATG
eukprot:TRINITY_DN8371_c0_g1_i1.p1 TRINITY_DN8371_c0_g1~~TRINITY_DN8371_c0_g1_i1.p1  ORF type:complete len:111 (+),score=7.70 TRINITY_DN8371_c0_g1_i1:380-712(+)